MAEFDAAVALERRLNNRGGGESSAKTAQRRT
jgi:hypothetical protein